jgi:hypothetical protein
MKGVVAKKAIRRGPVGPKYKKSAAERAAADFLQKARVRENLVNNH